MGKEIENIIMRQQEYEKLKRMSVADVVDKRMEAGITDDFLLPAVISEIGAAYNRYNRRRQARSIRIRRIWQIGIGILAAACELYVFSSMVQICVNSFTTIQEETGVDTEVDEAYENSPIRRAERAIESGDYDVAERILKDALSANPNGLFFYITYADLYMAQVRYDDAVNILADGIYNHMHVQNMLSDESPIYIKLKEIPADSLKNSRQAYEKCLADCDAYIGKHQEIERLLEEESFYSALKICNELKSEGAYDNYLCRYYYKCYCGLKAHDECREYLLGLYGKKQGVTDLRYPSDEELDSYLEKLKEFTN